MYWLNGIVNEYPVKIISLHGLFTILIDQQLISLHWEFTSSFHYTHGTSSFHFSKVSRAHFSILRCQQLISLWWEFTSLIQYTKMSAAGFITLMSPANSTTLIFNQQLASLHLRCNQPISLHVDVTSHSTTSRSHQLGSLH